MHILALVGTTINSGVPIAGNSGLLKAGEVTNLLYSTIYNSKLKSRAD